MKTQETVTASGRWVVAGWLGVVLGIGAIAGNDYDSPSTSQSLDLMDAQIELLDRYTTNAATMLCQGATMAQATNWADASEDNSYSLWQLKKTVDVERETLQKVTELKNAGLCR